MFEEELDKIDKAVDEQKDEDLQQSKNRVAEICKTIRAELDEVGAALHAADNAALKSAMDQLLREKRRCEEIAAKIEEAIVLNAAPASKHSQIVSI